MNSGVWVALMLGTFGACAWAQADTGTTLQGTPVTLLMDWTRGDRHYGPNFIKLERPCEMGACYCFVEFEVISSKENAKEFADYITAFEHGKVPVVYDVHFSKEGRVRGDRFVRVGDWTRDRFHVNDGLLGVGVRFRPNHAGQKTSANLEVANCFPSQQP